MSAYIANGIPAPSIPRLGRVERQEREVRRHAPGAGHDQEARQEAGRMDERRARWPFAGLALPQRAGRGLRHEERQQRRDDRHRRGGEPHRVEPGQAEDRLAEERPERQAEVHRQRADVDRLAATLRRREVADRREERRRRRRPRRPRAAPGRPRTTATSSATRWNSSATTVSSATEQSSGRRPNRSEAQPTTGRRARAAIAKAPIEMPTPVASAAAGRRRTGTPRAARRCRT